MTEQYVSGASVPQWDIADRMRKSLRETDIGVQEMADYLGVARNTVSTWINGRIVPSRQTVRLWALRTGVPYEWLETGQVPTNHGPGPEGELVHPPGLEPGTRWFGGFRPDLRLVIGDAA